MMETKRNGQTPILILRYTFAAMIIIGGIDKFFNFLTDWSKFIPPGLLLVLHADETAFTRIAAIPEIIIGLLVAFRPKTGGWLMAVLFIGIGSMAAATGFRDVALCDLTFAMCGIALAKIKIAGDLQSINIL